MSDDALQLGLMKVLATKHFPLQGQKPKLKIEKLLAILKKIDITTDNDTLFDNFNELKGRGFVNTNPKIILKDEADTAEFEIWLTPLGRTELRNRLAD